MIQHRAFPLKNLLVIILKNLLPEVEHNFHSMLDLNSTLERAEKDVLMFLYDCRPMRMAEQSRSEASWSNIGAPACCLGGIEFKPARIDLMTVLLPLQSRLLTTASVRRWIKGSLFANVKAPGILLLLPGFGRSLVELEIANEIANSTC